MKSFQFPLVRALFTEKARGAQTKVKVMPSGPTKSKEMKKSVSVALPLIFRVTDLWNWYSVESDKSIFA